MTSRTRALLVTAVAALAVVGAGAAAFGNRPAVFTVNGERWSRSRLNVLVDELVTAGQISAAAGRAPLTDVATVASVLVQYRAGAQMLAARGVEPAEADRAEARASLERSYKNRDVIELLADMAATGRALDQLGPVDDVASVYADSPARTGLLCAAEITVKSEAEARDLAARIDGGADFLTLAKANTVSEDFKDSGGIVGPSADQPCSTLDNVATRLSRELFEALVDTGAGSRTAVVRDPTGWHIAFNRPWSEVSKEHGKVFAEAPGRNLARGWVAKSDVRVNPEYGSWNPATSKIE